MWVRRCRGTATRSAPGRAQRGRAAGLVEVCGRLLARQGAKGGLHAGPSLVDRGRAGSKHVITDGHGTPLAVLLTGGNRNDVTQLLPLLDAVPPVRGRVGHPRRRPDSLFADRGYDQDVNRDQVRARGIVP
ncbi:LOW QUALITY PROTEIN: putative transposase for insertion sequence element, partial [Streptomyces himastatinicus ATCC 53653]